MDDDMERRIREKGGDAGTGIGKTILDQGKSAVGSIQNDIDKLRDDFDTSRNERERRAYCLQWRRSELVAINHAFNDIFENPSYIFLNVAAPFGRTFGPQKVSYPVTFTVSKGSADAYNEHIGINRIEDETNFFGTGPASFVILRLNKDRALKIDYRPLDNEDIYDVAKYKYVATLMGREFNSPTVSFPFIARNSWEDYSSSSVTFQRREEIIEYARDQLASAILEHRQQFAKNLAIRVAKGAAIVAFLMATDALAQDTGPAKDFSPHQPEEPAIGMSFDKR